jgi:hypothetical protein
MLTTGYRRHRRAHRWLHLEEEAESQKGGRKQCLEGLADKGPML